MNIDNLSYEQIRGREAEVKARREEVRPTFQHYGSAENLSDREISGMEAEIRARREEVRPTFQHYGSSENMSDREISGMEAEVKARREEVRPTFQHYGSAENMSDREIAGMEAEIRARREEVRPTFQHYGSVENLSDNDVRTMEAQVIEKNRQDIPFRQYLRDLVVNPKIFNEDAFELATKRSMESNGIIKEFVENLIEKISEKTYQFNSIDKNDKERIQTLKLEIENLVIIYEKYLYKLKENGWDFYNLNSLQLPEEYLEDLWQVQKSFDITFNMKIPSGIDEYYGKKFERDGKMIPGIRLMYDELMGKEVNWYQIITYKENELTPRQVSLQRQEEKRKAFESARQQEINSVLNQVREMNVENIGGRSI